MSRTVEIRDEGNIIHTDFSFSGRNSKWVIRNYKLRGDTSGRSLMEVVRFSGVCLGILCAENDNPEVIGSVWHEVTKAQTKFNKIRFQKFGDNNFLIKDLISII